MNYQQWMCAKYVQMVFFFSTIFMSEGIASVPWLIGMVAWVLKKVNVSATITQFSIMYLMTISVTLISDSVGWRHDSRGRMLQIQTLSGVSGWCGELPSKFLGFVLVSGFVFSFREFIFQSETHLNAIYLHFNVCVFQTSWPLGAGSHGQRYHPFSPHNVVHKPHHLYSMICSTG